MKWTYLQLGEFPDGIGQTDGAIPEEVENGSEMFATPIQHDPTCNQATSVID